MDGCVLLTSTPECVVSPRRGRSPSGDYNSGDYNMILANFTLNYQYFAY